MTSVSKSLVYCYCLFIAINVTCSQSCEYVNNLKVSYRTAESDNWKEVTVNGCIDDASLQSTNVKEINIQCKSQELTQIGQNFLRNLESLEKLWISGCQFESIDPGAFVNLPKLTDIIITKNTLKEIRKGVFEAVPSLNEIHLHENEISYIEDDAFANLPNLKVINMNDNQCEYMRKEWFTNSTSKVEKIFMSRNVLRQIPPRMFEGWRKLNFFSLNANQISIIHNKAFNDVAPVINTLDLHLNRLTSISLKSFSDPLHFEGLRLSANLFNYIPEEFVKKARIDYFYIHGNPFTCSCLETLYWLLYQKGGVIVNYSIDPYFYKPCYSASAPVCVVPSKSSRYCQNKVDAEATRTYLTYLKEIGYDDFKDYFKNSPCANFDAL